MFAPLLTRLAAALDEADIPYMVIGGQAVLVHGEPRLTRDIDVTVALGVEGLDRLLATVDQAGLQPLPDDPAAFARETMVLPAIDPGSGIRVDLILSFTTYELEAIERARPAPAGLGSVRFASAEDLIVHKMIAGRPRDLEDVRSILLRNPGLDRESVRSWLRDFEVAVESDVGLLERFALTEREVEGPGPS
jgi:hypothetical protein